MIIIAHYFRGTHQYAIFAERQQPREIGVRPDAKHELTDGLVVSTIAAEIGVWIYAGRGSSSALVNVYRHRKCSVLHRKVNNIGYYKYPMTWLMLYDGDANSLHSDQLFAALQSREFLHTLSGDRCIIGHFGDKIWKFQQYTERLHWKREHGRSAVDPGQGRINVGAIDAAALGPLLKIGPAENWLKFLWKVNSFFSHDVFTWKWFLA